MAVAVPYIMAATAAASVVQGRKAGKSAEASRREQARASAFVAKKQQRIADIKSQRERIQLARKMRLARAEQQNKQAASATRSSGGSGRLATIASQTSSAFNRADRLTSLAAEASIFNQNASASAQSYLDSAGRSQRASDMFTAAGTVASIFKTT